MSGPVDCGHCGLPLRSLTLTPREVQVLQALVDCPRQRSVGRLLGLSEHTIWHHLTHARLKLAARTTAQAVAIAWSRGLIR